jgi:hypothetical protein
MSFKVKILITCCGIVAFDAVASVLSRIFQLQYTKFAVGSLLIYVVAGFLGAFRRGFFYGLLLGAIAGFTGSTVGWLVSQKIGPFMEPPMPSLDAGLIAITVVIVTLLAVAVSSVGAVLCTLVKQTRSADA